MFFTLLLAKLKIQFAAEDPLAFCILLWLQATVVCVFSVFTEIQIWPKFCAHLTTKNSKVDLQILPIHESKTTSINLSLISQWAIWVFFGSRIATQVALSALLLPLLYSLAFWAPLCSPLSRFLTTKVKRQKKNLRRQLLVSSFRLAKSLRI